jgi:hypothetical protein
MEENRWFEQYRVEDGKNRIHHHCWVEKLIWYLARNDKELGEMVPVVICSMHVHVIKRQEESGSSTILINGLCRVLVRLYAWSLFGSWRRSSHASSFYDLVQRKTNRIKKIRDTSQLRKLADGINLRRHAAYKFLYTCKAMQPIRIYICYSYLHVESMPEGKGKSFDCW